MNFGWALVIYFDFLWNIASWYGIAGVYFYDLQEYYIGLIVTEQIGDMMASVLIATSFSFIASPPHPFWSCWSKEKIDCIKSSHVTFFSHSTNRKSDILLTYFNACPYVAAL